MLSNVEDVKALILWCRDNGVTALKLGGLEAVITPAPRERVAHDPTPTYKPPSAKKALLDELQDYG